jgi:hypothetical protein
MAVRPNLAQIGSVVFRKLRSNAVPAIVSFVQLFPDVCCGLEIGGIEETALGAA